MEYHKINWSEEQRKEAIRLMLGVSCVKSEMRFIMGNYAVKCDLEGEGDDGPDIEPCDIKNECGTAACLLGHAPLFCKLKPNAAWSWGIYSHELFGLRNAENHFLFGWGWPDCHRQAVARLYIALTKGTPYQFYSHILYDVPDIEDIVLYAMEYGITIDEVML